MSRLFVIAGEPSGDQLGGALIEAIRRREEGRKIEIAGIGGTRMEETGLVSLVPMRELAIMGFTEILPHIGRILRRVRETVLAIEAYRPDVLLTIDSPGFVNRVIAGLRKRGVVRPRFVHYVAPTVWAYKPGRVHRSARLYDRLMVLLPFEPPLFHAAGLETDFVGHPVVDDLDAAFAPRPLRENGALRLLLLPGSRRGELKRMMPVFADTVKRLANHYPGLRPSILAPRDLAVEVRDETREWVVRPDVVTRADRRRDAFAMADVALAKSGTVTLEVAKHGLPLVMAYRVNPISAFIARRMMLTKFFCLINIIESRRIVPELMQEHCTGEAISAALIDLVETPGAIERQRHENYAALARMRAPGTVSASETAAGIVVLELGSATRS